MQKRKIIDPLLLLIPLVVIIGFQVYWLKDNYDREKKSLQIKTGVTFQEAVRDMQVSKLRLPGYRMIDSMLTAKTRVFINEDLEQAKIGPGSKPRRQMITMVNALRSKMNDSVKKGDINSTVVIAVGKGTRVSLKDSSMKFTKRIDTGDHVFKMLYGVDSLQDSIQLPELVKAYTLALKKENLNVPFTITKSEATTEENEDLSEVTVGFAHPITYKLTLLNTTPYLLRKISLPILFSIFLVGVTILSFVLLYRNLARQRRLAEIKNEFISNITHELKTPIATVGVAIEALKNFNAMHDPEKTKEYLEISGNELQRLSLLVDKVLKLSMFEKKQIELNKEDFDLKVLTQEVLDSMRLQFEKNNAVVNFNVQGDKFMINADKLHITSVIYNLLDNALKYSKEDPVINLAISAKSNIVELKVNDNGIGIAPEYRKKIFDKFFRVPTGNKHSVKGYGLGLSYVSEIVDRHNGFIDVKSDINKGSTFAVSLPM